MLNALRLLGLGISISLVTSVFADDKPPFGAGAPAPERKAPEAARTDNLGDPLPDGAVARLGTVRFRLAYWVGGIQPSRDGKVLFSVGSPNEVQRWEVASGKALPSWKIDMRGVGNGLAVAARASRLAFGGGRGVFVLDSDSGRIIREIHSSRIASVALSPDGKLVAAAIHRSGRFVWDCNSGDLLLHSQTNHAVEQGSFPATGSPVFSYDGRRLFWGAGPHIRAWDVVAGRKLIPGQRKPATYIPSHCRRMARCLLPAATTAW